MTDEGRTDRDPLVRARTLLREVTTLHLATVSDDGFPEASYAPFVAADGALHVYVSELASHAHNLSRTAHASVMLIRDEGRSPQPFARLRLGLQCRATALPRETPDWRCLLDRFSARFGHTVELIRPLEDFVLFRLEPVDGRLVEGFARAHRLPGKLVAALLRET